MPLTLSLTSAHEITGQSLITVPQLEEFGHKLLQCSVTSKELFDLLNASVNYDVQKRAYSRNDFIDMIDGLAFSGMQEFARCWVPGNPWPQNGPQWAGAISRHLSFFFKQHPEFPEMYRMEAVKRLVMPSTVMPGDHDLVCDGAIDYIRAVRRHYDGIQTKGMTPAARLKAETDTYTSVRLPGQVVTFQSSEDIMESVFALAAPTKPFASGIATFDSSFASKALAGDAWLMFGHPGGGKTNLACQIAGFSAKMGRRVMYVTTEVPKPILLLRAFSSTTRSSYAAAKMMAGSMGNHPMAKSFTEWARGYGNNLGIMDYRDISGADYKEKFRRMIDLYFEGRGMLPDLIVWDWIGKALDSGFADPWQKREAYNGVASMMVDTAAQMKIQTVTLAQASKETKNRSSYVESDTADSKSLCDGMTGVAGITSLLSAGDGNSGDSKCHQEMQYLVVCKCREEATQKLAVIRRFDTAKFESV